MAPEKVCSFIVLDLESAGGSLTATRYVSPEGPRFLLKWYPLRTCPEGFQAVAGGVIHVPKTVAVDPCEPNVTIEPLHAGHHYRDYSDMLVIVMPRGAHLGEARPGPSGAKEHDGRLAVYWLAPAASAIDVEWSIVGAGADPERAALAINTEVRRTAGPMPRLSIDDCELYDVAVSYASEDRAHAEPLVRALEAAGCHVFYDDDADLWGKDLAAELPAIYGRRARYCLVLVSATYATKMWTNVERRSAVARAAEQRGREYVLPVRIDGTGLEGLPPSVAYRSISEGPGSLASLVMKKVARGSA
jgi:TIR domain